ncbi:putative protein HEAT INTOLERANT 4 [Helianthus debilis subsp. tardiflorus]
METGDSFPYRSSLRFHLCFLCADLDRRGRTRRDSSPSWRKRSSHPSGDSEDLWKQAFPVGTEWDQIDLLLKHNWNFSNLEDAFEEGGILHGKKVYIFSCTEPQAKSIATLIPVVIAVVSPYPPSDKIVCTSVKMASEEIIDMKRMKMDWVPYIPLGKRDSSVERLKTQIFVLGCVQRRAGLKHLKLERVKKFEYCIPYVYNPLEEDETEQSTIVDILYPAKPEPVFCQFDLDMDELEEFTNERISAEELSEDQWNGFKKFVREKVGERKRANHEAQKGSEQVKTSFRRSEPAA